MLELIVAALIQFTVLTGGTAPVNTTTTAPTLKTTSTTTTTTTMQSAAAPKTTTNIGTSGWDDRN